MTGWPEKSHNVWGRETFNMVLVLRREYQGEAASSSKTTAGRQICDNSLPARLDRMWAGAEGVLLPCKPPWSRKPVRRKAAHDSARRYRGIQRPHRNCHRNGRGPRCTRVVQVGDLGLVGEVVRLVGDRAIIQVYEDTTMLKPGAPVECTGAPLSVWLGPGLLGNIYDGIQRPLPGIQAKSGAWIRRGEKVDPLDSTKLWTFEPQVKPGDKVIAGEALGRVPETPLVDHLVMVPPGISGIVRSIVEKRTLLIAPDPGRYRYFDGSEGSLHAAALGL